MGLLPLLQHQIQDQFFLLCWFFSICNQRLTTPAVTFPRSGKTPGSILQNPGSPGSENVTIHSCPRRIPARKPFLLSGLRGLLPPFRPPLQPTTAQEEGRAPGTDSPTMDTGGSEWRGEEGPLAP